MPSNIPVTRLQGAARLVGAVIVAVVTVHLPLPQLSARLVLQLAAAAAVIVIVVAGRRGPLVVLLVAPAALVMAVFFGAALRLSVQDSHRSLGVVHSLEVVVVVHDVPVRQHLQVRSGAVVARACVVTEVDDAALVGALVRRLDSGEAEFMRDVASHNLHNLAEIKGKKERMRL